MPSTTPRKKVSKKAQAAAEEQKAATKMQAISRGHAARKEVHEMKASSLWKYRCLKCLQLTCHLLGPLRLRRRWLANPLCFRSLSTHKVALVPSQLTHITQLSLHLRHNNNNQCHQLAPRHKPAKRQ